MSRQPMTIEPDATLKDAAERLLYLDVHRLFVVKCGVSDRRCANGRDEPNLRKKTGLGAPQQV